MSTEAALAITPATQTPAPVVRRKRRRRTLKQLDEIHEQLLRRQERLALSPIKPVSRAHPVGMRPIHEFLTTGQVAAALRITRNRVHELMRAGRLTPSPVRMGIDTFLFHKSTSYQRRIPAWLAKGEVISATDGTVEPGE